jgi:hypothetical protein
MRNQEKEENGTSIEGARKIKGFKMLMDLHFCLKF